MGLLHTPHAMKDGKRLIDRPTRRGILRLGAGVAASALLEYLLPGFGEAQASPAKAVAVETAKARNLILVILTGGMSQLDSWDYRRGAPDEVRGPFKPVETKSKRFFGEHFPKMAGIDDKFMLMTAMKATSYGSHDTAYKDWLNTGATHLFRDVLGSTQGLRYVDGVAPGVRPLMEPERKQLLLSEALEVLWDEDKKDYLCAVGEKPPNLDERMALRAKLDTARFGGDQVERMADHYKRAYAILTRGLTDAFADADPMVKRGRMRRYGDHPYGRLFSLAGQLADPQKGNVKLVVVETGDWDHHDEMQRRFGIRAPFMDQALAALIEEYGDRLIISARGEFGRTGKPQTNTLNNYGRNHDPRHAGILAGPTVKPGVYGKSDFYRIESEDVSDAAYAHTLLAATGDLARDKATKHIKELLKAA